MKTQVRTQSTTSGLDSQTSIGCESRLEQQLTGLVLPPIKQGKALSASGNSPRLDASRPLYDDQTTTVSLGSSRRDLSEREPEPSSASLFTLGVCDDNIEQEKILRRTGGPLTEQDFSEWRQTRDRRTVEDATFARQHRDLTVACRQANIKSRVVDKQANRSLVRLDSDIRRNQEILSIFPAWKNQFKRLCNKMIAAIEDVDEPASSYQVGAQSTRTKP